MFERYTEIARRAIFFARYEASQFGKLYIETEHLLLGILREDKELASRLLGSGVESIRREIEEQTTAGEKVSTSIDLPLSHESKRALAYGAEEAERLQRKHIGCEHLLLGLLREAGSFAARLLNERGVTLESAREQVRRSATPEGELVVVARLERWLAECEVRDGIHTFTNERVGNSTAQFAVCGEEAEEEHSDETGPAAEAAKIRKRIASIVKERERAIADQDFEKARFYSDEVGKERDALAALGRRFLFEVPPRRMPFLCIDVIGDARFGQVRKRCEAYLAQGVAQVWLLAGDRKRAYTATEAEGLREFRGEILKIANPPLELDLRTIFD